MATVAKRYKKSAEAVDENKLYSVAEAATVLSKFQKTKFDETIDIAIRLGVDPKHADQMVRGAILLPNGTGKSVRVVVITKGEKEAEAKAAGADHVGSDDLIDKIKEGWLDFDKLIATPDMMAKVGKIGTVLGPRGLMPNPKTGTVTPDVTKAVKEIKAGRVEYKVDKAGIVHTIVGKLSFDSKKLEQNISSLMDSIVKAKPSSAKGTYIKSVTVSSTMGPGISIDPAAFGV
jgi:large subunit ribosomal protein L1